MTDHPVRSLALLRRTEIDIEKRRLDAFLETYDWLVKTYEVGQAEGPADTGEPRGVVPIKATSQGSVSSPANETAATVDELMDCYRSGQMQPGEMLAHINANPELRRRYLEAVRAHQAKKAAQDTTESDAQPDGQALAAPVEPEATSPASAREPHTCGSGEAPHGVPTASPPYNGAALAPTEPQPAAPDEATADPANEGGDDAQVDDHEPKSPEGPASHEAAPAPTDTAGPELSERQQQMLDWLEGEADAEGWIETSHAAAAAGTGIPKGSLQGTLEALERLGFVEPRARGMTAPIRLAEGVRRRRDQENTESREDGAAPTAEPEAEPQQAPASGAAAPGTPLPKSAAFDSSVPKPAWDSGKDRRVAEPASNVGPPRLAVAGDYLFCRDHNVRLGKEQATIMARLVKDWGSPVSKSDLAGEIMSRSLAGLSAKKAGEHLTLKQLGDLNALLKPAGLVVFESNDGWRLTERQEAGAVPA